MQTIFCRLLERARGPRVQVGSLALLLFVITTAVAYPLSGVMEPDNAGANPWRAEVELRDRATIPSVTWKTAGQVPVWKTIRLGTYSSVNTLLEALDSDTCGSDGQQVAQSAASVRTDVSGLHDAPHCHLGESAGEIIGRPAFRLSRTRQELDLVVVSVTELGFAGDAEVPLADIHDRADLLGFALCPAEAGPQLRLQYLDQPVGEFLQVAMEPIVTYAGEPIDLTIGNGGAGLLLIGGAGRPDITFPAIARFVFVRPRPQR